MYLRTVLFELHKRFVLIAVKFAGACKIQNLNLNFTIVSRLQEVDLKQMLCTCFSEAHLGHSKHHLLLAHKFEVKLERRTNSKGNQSNLREYSLINTSQQTRFSENRFDCRILYLEMLTYYWAKLLFSVLN